MFPISGKAYNVSLIPNRFLVTQEKIMKKKIDVFFIMQIVHVTLRFGVCLENSDLQKDTWIRGHKIMFVL